MNSITRVIMIAVLLVVCNALNSLAMEGWELTMHVKAGKAESKLSFGQQSNATASRDGYYDVPAMFSGSLQTAFLNGGGTLWRDIRSGQDVEWQLQIDSQVGEPITVSWESQAIPTGITVQLVDTVSRESVDMKSTSDYIITDISGGYLTIRVTSI